ncbi:MAG TPA: GNAT family N-acetyltransferase [Clostridia bacterium]
MLINKIEELSMNAWPSIQTKLYDGWVLRFSDGYTKRANSVNPIYESTIKLDEKIDFCEKQYSLFDIPAVFKLTGESNPKGIDKRLEERGYTKIDETSVKILNLKQYTYNEPKDIKIETNFSDEWIDGFFWCSCIDKRDQTAARKILGNIMGEVICVTRYENKEFAGCGFCAIERGFAGIFDIVVEKSHRRKGYGKEIISSILSEAYKKGVRTTYLQVVVGNTPAERLYDKLGFNEAYRYWYRKQEKFQ